MKNAFQIIVLALMSIMLTSEVFAVKQFDSDRKKQRQMNREIKKESRRLEKEGYSVEPGAPTMNFQLRRSYEYEYEMDESGAPKYIVAVGSAISGIQNAARMHAVSDATVNASIKLESQIMGLIETDFNNKLYSRDEFKTLSQMKGVFSNLLAQSLPTAVPVTAFVRDNGKNYEYQIRLAYPIEALQNKAKETIRDILSKENDDLRKKFERITDFENLGR